MNQVFLIGRLTKDVELKYTPSQSAVASFSIAIDRGKDKEGNDRGADFPRVTVFGKQAENCERYLKKGRLVAIQGRIQTGSYEKDGHTFYTTDVIADRVEFIEWGDKPQNAPQSEEKQCSEQIPTGYEAIDMDIPF